MFLFSRAARLGPGNLQDQMAWALNITEKVNQITELDVSLWTTVFSPGLSTLTWVAAVEDLELLEASDAKLFADSGYLSLVEEGAKFSSGQAIDDGLLSLVLADEDAANVTATYASVVQAVTAPGNATKAIEVGVDLAQRAKKITGCPTSFGVAATGPYGAVEWITVYESVKQLQAAQTALASDTSFANAVDKDAGKVYLPGTATQLAVRKLA